MRRVWLWALVALAFSACSERPTTEVDNSIIEPPNNAVAAPPSAEGKPGDKIESMRPADQAAFLQAFDDRKTAIRNAPNSVAREEVEKAEDPKLCAVIEGLKEFKNWTAEVRSITKPDNNPNEIIIVMSLNNSIVGYLVTDHVGMDSPLYSKITPLKDGILHGSDVAISGTVKPREQSADASDCIRHEDFDVTLSAIEPL